MMPTLSEMFIGDIQKQNSEPLSKSDAGWQTGVQLAQLQQQKQKQQQDLAMKMQELQQTKLEKMHSYIADARNYKNPKDRNNYLKSAIGYRNAMNLPGEMLPDEVIMSLGSDENTGRLAHLDLMLKNGEITPEQYVKTVNDAQLFGKVNPLIEDATYDADPDKTIEEILKRKSAEKAARGKGDATQSRFEDSKMMQLGDKVIASGIPDMYIALNNLDNAGNLTNWKPGQRIPGITGNEGRVVADRLKDPDAIAVRQNIAGVANLVLKMRSGAAINENEADRILGELGYSPTLGEGGKWNLVWKGKTSEQNIVNGMRGIRAAVENRKRVWTNTYGSDRVGRAFEGVDTAASVPRTKVTGTIGGGGSNTFVGPNGKSYPTSNLDAMEKVARDNKDQAMLNAIKKARDSAKQAKR